MLVIYNFAHAKQWHSRIYFQENPEFLEPQRISQRTFSFATLCMRICMQLLKHYWNMSEYFNDRRFESNALETVSKSPVSFVFSHFFQRFAGCHCLMQTVVASVFKTNVLSNYCSRFRSYMCWLKQTPQHTASVLR